MALSLKNRVLVVREKVKKLYCCSAQNIGYYYSLFNKFYNKEKTNDIRKCNGVLLKSFENN